MQSSSSLAETENSIGLFLQSILKVRRVHAKSLISTFFGDVVMPIDGYTWVETISSVLRNLGVNDRLVRTSLFRLREEGWVVATRSGRKSYYQLTKSARSQTRLAERLIYHSQTPQWDGAWTLIFMLVQPLEKELRRELEQELSWIGFGSVTKRVWAHPGDSTSLVAERVKRLGLDGKVICMRCENIHNVELGFTMDDRDLASLCMPTSDVETGYQQFVETFSPMLDQQGKFTLVGSSSEMLSLRLLMMDEFRRILLHDHHLPPELLPSDWAGSEAFDLCGSVYRQIYLAANDHYRQLQSNAGSMKNLSSVAAGGSDFELRFSGGRAGDKISD